MTNYEEQLMALCEDVQQVYDQIYRNQKAIDDLNKISNSQALTDAISALSLSRNYGALALSSLSRALITERGKS